MKEGVRVVPYQTYSSSAKFSFRLASVECEPYCVCVDAQCTSSLGPKDPFVSSASSMSLQTVF